MKIIISPAKKMHTDYEGLPPKQLPVLLEKTEIILQWLQQRSYIELKQLWACNDAIAELNYERLKQMDLRKAFTPAISAYDGIQYQYMGPSVFDYDEFSYIEEHLRILSGFYGILKPMDAVVPYRLEMQAKAAINGNKNLYAFWSDSLYQELIKGKQPILNLASKEYSLIIEKYLKPDNKFITCVFGELINGKVVQKGVYAKMARGEMVRYLACNNITEPEAAQGFSALNYQFCPELSGPKEYVFIRSK